SARRRRDDGLGLSLEHLPRRNRIRDLDCDPLVPADGSVRHGTGGEGMNCGSRSAAGFAAAIVLLVLADLVLPRVLNTYYLTILARIPIALLAAVCRQP